MPATPHPVRWQIAGRVLSNAEHTLIMGVLNVTPDSFSDGGRYPTADAAVARGLRMQEQGADIVDVGGESTRPGAAAVTPAEEMERVLPVVSRLAAAGVVVSIDTSKPQVAAAALGAGAAIVNDVTALGSPGMAEVVARSGAGLVLMHMQGTPRTMQIDPRYDNVTAEVAAFLEERATAAEAAGIHRERICIDPGIGFGKTLDHNLQLMQDLPLLTESGRPVLLGTSRKSFLGAILGEDAEEARDQGTAATVALAIAAGVAVVRVHNVALMQRIARVADAIVRDEV